MRPDSTPRPAGAPDRSPPPASVRCPDCGGTGFRVIREGGSGRSYAGPCPCTREERVRALLRRARIPSRYSACDFGSFSTDARFDPSIERACMATREFVQSYSARRAREEAEFGLLLLGPPGVGKTHLAVAALRELILEHGVQGLFADFRELIKSLQASYDPLAQDSEMELLRPLVQAEVLVFDDLGAARMTEWVRDMVGHIVNSRYNERKVTLITSNLSDAPAGKDSNHPVLTERIGPAVRSRLHEMCVSVEITGKDFRVNEDFRLNVKRSTRRPRRRS